MKVKRRPSGNKINAGVGKIILAKPFCKEEIYKRSVILILEHDDTGSTGVIVNKLSSTNMETLLPLDKIKAPVYYGGPCETEVVSYIHTIESLPGRIKIGDSLFIGGDFDKLKERIGAKKALTKKIRFFAGHVLWKPDQLKSEIENDDWWIFPASPPELIVKNADAIWSDKLKSMGHVYGEVNRVWDPRLN